MKTQTLFRTALLLALGLALAGPAAAQTFISDPINVNFYSVQLRGLAETPTGVQAQVHVYDNTLDTATNASIQIVDVNNATTLYSQAYGDYGDFGTPGTFDDAGVGILPYNVPLQITITGREFSNFVAILGDSIAAQGGYAPSLPAPVDPVIFTTTIVLTQSSSIVLDQQNLLDGAIGGQGIGRFNDLNGVGDPTGTSFDFQDAQVFTAGTSGLLAEIRLPIYPSPATPNVTEPVFLDMRQVTGGVPESNDGLNLGSVSLPASAFASVQYNDPSTWAVFNVRSLGIYVAPGQQLAFSVRTADTTGYIYNPEITLGYDAGEGYRRNLAVSATWGTSGDFGFQTFVVRPPQIDYVSLSTARATSEVNFSALGINVGYDVPSTVQLQNGPFVYPAFAVGTTGLNFLNMSFDLTGAPVGGYDLVIANSAGVDTLFSALVVYDEIVDLSRITTDFSGDRFPSFTRPGTVPERVAFFSNREVGGALWVKEPGTIDFGNAQRITDFINLSFPSWSADGSRIAFYDGNADDVYTVDVVAGTSLPPVAELTGGSARGPAYSPVDNRIAFSRPVGGGSRGLFTIIQGTDIVQQITFPGPNTLHGTAQWSPDGARLVYAVADTTGGLTETSIVSRSSTPGPGTEKVLLDNGFLNYGPVWSPDGQWIAFYSNMSGNFDIWVMNSNGAEFGLIQLTNDPANDAEPSWSPDGTAIAFASTRSGLDPANGNPLDLYLATSLPISVDTDGDLVPDIVDACPTVAPGPGEVDRDFDGCADPGSSFRFNRFWQDDQFPVMYQTDADGDPSITDGSDFLAVSQGFGEWTNASPVLDGGDDLSRLGPSDAVSGDTRNSITFQDPDGFRWDAIALTLAAVAVEDTVINGTWYRPKQIVDADILFNTFHYDFYTSTATGPSGSFFLPAVAAHECGHLFGFSHTGVYDATMFYAIHGENQDSLDEDDQALCLTAYQDPNVLPLPFAIGGYVLRGDDLSPVVGAAVLAFNDDTGDTLQMALTRTDGSYAFHGLGATNVRLYASPLDGGPPVNGLTPSRVNSELEALAETDFLPEYYDGVAESNSDFGTSGVVLNSGSFPITDATILTNLDTAGPLVDFTYPATGDTIAASSAISVKFNEKIDLGSITGSTFSVETLIGGVGVGGAAALLQYDSLLVFTPDTTLAYDTDYVLTVGPDITDIFGNPMTTPYIVNFRVEPQPPLTITGVSPSEVSVGGVLTVSGTGFSTTAADNQAIFYPGLITATAYGATLEQAFFQVPPGVVSGEIYMVVASNPDTSNGFPITVVPPRGIPVGTPLGDASLGGNPRKVEVGPGGEYAYVAHSAGVSAVNADPTDVDFLTEVVEIPFPGGCPGLAVMPDGRRVLALSSSPPSLEVIDSDPTSLFLNTVVAGEGVPLVAEPLGIAAIPGANKVLIVYANRVVRHSAQSGADFGLEGRQWADTGVSFLGDIAVSVDGAEAYATTTDGRIAVLGLGTGEGIVGYMTAGTDPREIAVRGDGLSLFGVDGGGTIREYANRGPLLASTSTPGGFDGLTSSPDGGYAYAANYILNKIDVFDISVSPPGLASSIGTGVDPTDVTTGGGGRYIYVTTAASDLLEVYDSENGPMIQWISPGSGPTGALVTLKGSGFEPGVSVYWDGTAVPADSVSADSTVLVTRVPSRLPLGNVTVNVGGASNTVAFKVVQVPDEGNLSVAATSPLGGATDLSNTMESPSGDLIFATDNTGGLFVVRGDPAAEDYLRVLQYVTPTETGWGTVASESRHSMAVRPDGAKIYGINGNTINLRNVDPGAASPVTGPIATVVDSTGGTAIYGPSELAMTPGGRLLSVNVEAQNMAVINTERDSIEAVFPVPSQLPAAMAVHPDGSLAFVGNYTVNPRIEIVDIDRNSATYGQVLGTVDIITPSIATGPYQLVPSPNGSRLYALTERVVGISGQWEVHEIDIDRASPGFGSVLSVTPVTLDTRPALALNHSGTVLFVLAAGDAAIHAYSTAGMTLLGNTGFYVQFAGSYDLSVSLDDGRLYAPGFGGNLIVVDVTQATGMNLTSGFTQTGVVGQPLPAPLEAQLTSSTGPVEGALVRFQASPTSGHFGFPDQTAFRVSDENGYVRVNYTAGLTAGPDTVQVASAVGVIDAFLNVVADPSTAPPQILSVVPTTADTPGISTKIAVDFSKAMASGTVSATGNFTVTDAVTGVTVTGRFSFANGNRRAVFTPGALAYDTQYNVALTGGIQDTYGFSLSNPGTYSFTTGSPPPATLNSVSPASGVPGNTVVLAGQGFSSNVAQNTVLFNGASALPTSGGTGTLNVILPFGVSSGDVRVVVSGGAVPDTSNAISFTVLPSSTTPVSQVTGVTSVPTSGQQIAVLPNGSRAYMTSSGANTVVPVNLSTGMSESAISVGLHPFAVAAGPNSRRVYATNYFSNTLSVIGTDPGNTADFHRVIATIPTGLNPTGVAVHPDGNTVYVANYGDSTVSFIDSDPASATYNLVQASINTGSSSKAVVVSPDGFSLILGTPTGLLLLDAESGAAQASINTGSSSKAVVVTPDGFYAVVLTEDNDVLLIDIRPGTAEGDRAQASINTGSSSKAVVVSPDGAYVYVTTEDDNVLVYQIVALGGSPASPERGAGALSRFTLQLVATVEVGENPVGMAIDPVTNTLLVVNSGDATITFINVSGISTDPFSVMVDADPNTLNLKSKGKFVSAAIQFPIYIDPADLDLSSVLMNGVLHADTTQSQLTDKNEDGILEHEVKFPRAEALDILPEGEEVPVVITGIVAGRTFTGSDTIRVFRPVIKNPKPASIVEPGSQTAIRWSPSTQGPGDHLDIYLSLNAGGSWDTLATGTEDDSLFVWDVPDTSSTECLIMLVSYNEDNEVLGIGGMDGTFAISRVTGAEPTLPVRFAMLPASPNPFGAATNLRFDLPEPTQVTLRVFGLDGSLVRTLAVNEAFPAGRHAVLWDGRNSMGQRTGGGVYFVRIQAGKNVAVKKVVRVSSR